MLKILQHINSVVWGVPALLLIVGVGALLTYHTGFAQLRLLPRGLFSFFRPIFIRDSATDKSKRRALYTALAATVGTGNLVGVAGAIALGGPGAVFWMWVCGLLGMVTKMAEATLAVRYRDVSNNGEYYGGPMYMIMRTLKPGWHWLSYIYCFFGIVASFGVGNGTQINAVVGGVNAVINSFGFKGNLALDLLIGCCLAVLIYRVMSKGDRGIAAAAERLVPAAAMVYIVLCLCALVICRRQLPGAIRLIFSGAFTPRAATGGMIGSALISIRVGTARGVFTNEAGMGTASIAHATAVVEHPVEQGLMGIVEVFIDTIVICTLTALVILASGTPIYYGQDTGIDLTASAFVAVYGQWVSVLISISLCLFAIATVLGWGMYGIHCVRFLFGNDHIKIFVWAHAIVAVVSAVMQTDTLWLFAEIVNGLMAIPNLIVLVKLAPYVGVLVREFEAGTCEVRHDRSRTVFPCGNKKANS